MFIGEADFCFLFWRREGNEDEFEREALLVREL